jgi:hypothetical protein
VRRISRRCRALYLRHGLDDFGEPVHLPDGPSLRRMCASHARDATNAATEQEMDR